jgi:hypothetical protein
MELKACPGRLRGVRCNWFIPNGKTAEECTYCEWCISHGCVQLEEGYRSTAELERCNCDCPILNSHAVMLPYNCGNHSGMIGDCMMGRCRICYTEGSTTSSANKYCRDCSALYSICEICGVNAEGKKPFAPRPKMLSFQNGRI